MYCPRCSQLQTDENTRFCSRCGFLLTAISQVLANAGEFPFSGPNVSRKSISPRKRGLKQGVLLLFAGIIIVPLIAIISMAINMDPSLTAIVAILTFVGSILRMIYALLFEESFPVLRSNTNLPNQVFPDNSINRNELNSATSFGTLPPQPAEVSPASDIYMPPKKGSWQDTNELAPPLSVTENTTKFLDEKD